MYQTYQNFLRISKIYDGEEETDRLVERYQQDADPLYLAVIFCRNFGYIKSQVDIYFNITLQDKASLAVEELHKAMLDFEQNKGAKFLTFYSRYLNNRLRSETQFTTRHRRKANNNCDDYEDAIKTHGQSYEDINIEKAEIIIALRQSDILNERELKYCEIVITNGDKIRDIEISKELDITPSALHQMKKRLANKLKDFNSFALVD